MLRTRDRLIEVAHKLFLLKGVENTTMRDIADASDKGRRTLYLYFKSKGEIFNAVIKRECDAYIASLDQIMTSDRTSKEKLELYIDRRFQVLELMENHHESFIDWLRNGFRSNTKHEVLTSIRMKESKILDNIINDGIRDGEFDPDTCQGLSALLPSLVHSAYIIKEQDGVNNKANLNKFIINAVKKKTI